MIPCYKIDFLLLGIEASQEASMAFLQVFDFTEVLWNTVWNNNNCGFGWFFLSKLQLEFQQRYSDLSCRKLENMWYCTFHLSSCQRKYHVREIYREKNAYSCLFLAYVIYLFPLLLYYYNYSISPFIIYFSALSQVYIYFDKFVTG